MKHRNFKSSSIIAILFMAVAMICLAWPVQLLAADSATLKYETQALDLDTGEVIDYTPDMLEDLKGADIIISYNSDRIPHAVVMTVGESATLTFLSDTKFDNVKAADVTARNFSANVVDKALRDKDTVMVKTDRGAVYKIGKTKENDDGITVTYKELK